MKLDSESQNFLMAAGFKDRLRKELNMRIEPTLRITILLIGLLVLGALSALRPAFAARETPKAAVKHVDIWSDGTRMSGDLWWPKRLNEGKKFPAILMTHGWGGLRSHLNRTYAPTFAAGGFIVLTFDYRGWGDSDSKLVIVGEQPRPDSKGEVTVKARAIREVVDPFDQVLDITHALDFLMGEPGVDTERIGIWGTSYSGGHVVYVAAHDPRVKVIVSQVGSQDSTGFVKRRWAAQGGLEFAHQRAIDKARGVIDPIPQGIDMFPRLKGTPDVAKMAHYSPIAFAERISVPILIIDAESEELFDRMKHGHALYEIVKSRTVAQYKTFPGKHYDIYTKHYPAAEKLALKWFQIHLEKGE